ncbi:MAG: TldD/PmbA family protein [Candidatus Lokiarchaeota archaeon]|nr:TldD/PmbA family protein [Candidatus Lokiarchaeota archaeon]
MLQDHDIYSISNKILNSLNQNNEIKCSEVFFDKTSYINIEIEENSIKYSKLASERGLSIRIIDKRGSLGFSFTNKLENKPIESIVKTAISMMNCGTPDPDFKNLPLLCNSYPEVKGIYDEKIKDLDIEDSSKYIDNLIRICDEDEKAISQSAKFKSSYNETYIFNSNGIELYGKDTICSISSNMIVKDKISKQTSFGFDWQSVRNIRDLDSERIASNALEKAKQHLNRKNIKNMKAPIILTPTGTINLIISPIISAINAENFQYKRSFLIGKRGEKIGTDILNIEDNALINGATGSSCFDDEGVPCKNKKIIEKGIFLKQGLLHNSYTAAKEGIDPTGNSIRTSYSSLPSIDCTNFILKSGNENKEDIISDINLGILFEYSGDSANLSTGDFSGLILQGNLIENGEIKHSLNNTMFGINLLDLFQNISQISKEYQIYGPYSAPYVCVDNVQIIGNKN